MKIYEVCIEQEYVGATTVAIALTKKKAYDEMQNWIEDYGDAVFIRESETID